jgi:hypothetical protein
MLAIISTIVSSTGKEATLQRLNVKLVYMEKDKKQENIINSNAHFKSGDAQQ